MPEPTGDALWARIRYDYESTTRPIEDICAEHGVSSGTLRDRVRRWKWQRRRTPIPRVGPPAFVPAVEHDTATPGAATFPNPDPTEKPPHPRSLHQSLEDPPDRPYGTDIDPAAAPGIAADAGDPALIVQRLQGAASRVLPAIEAIIARLAAGSHHPREMEQAGRALGALTRTLRELNALLAQHAALAPQPYDDMPEDMDAFRNELARRIHAFVKSRRAQDEEATTQET